MKTTAIILLSFAVLFAAGGCSNNGGFSKTKSGLLYKIISDGKNPLVKKGQFIKVNYTQRIRGGSRDTVLQSSYGSLPTYAPVDSLGPVYNPAEVFNKLRRGDSAVIVMMADTLIRKSGQLPPFIHKRDKLQLTLKVLDVFNSEDDLRKDQQAMLDQRKQVEIADIQKYLSSKNIKAEKTARGVFVVIENKGDGPAVDSGKAAHVKYRGQTFAGKVFDSNLDSTFGHSEPFVLNIGKHGAIEGWDDGLRLFNKGGKGRLYIPSMLAYGPNPPPGAPFKAFENLIFDVEVVDVTDPKEQPMPGMHEPPSPPETAPAAPQHSPATGKANAPRPQANGVRK